MLFCLKQLMSRFHVVALALLFAVTVAGCGGGSSTSTADMDGDGMMTPADADKVADAQGRAGTAATMAQDAADKAGMLDPIDAATQAEIVKANAAAGAAAAAQTIADGTDNPGTAEAAADLAEAEQGKAETAYMGAMTASAAAQTAMDDEAERMRLMMAATAAALTKEKAIAAEGMSDGAGGIGGGTAADLAIAHKDGAVSITVSRGAGDDKVEFMSAMDLTGPNGFVGTMNMLGPNDDGETEIAIVYTDIDGPKATPFETAHPLNTNNFDHDDDANTAEVSRSLTIASVNIGMASADEFPSTPSTTREYAQDDAGTEDMNEGAIEGTFNGADGTFECITAGCEIKTDAMGMLTMVEGTWRFTPDKDETVDVPDADYLHYGVWLMKTDDEDGTTYNMVQTFAGSSMTDATSGSDIDGVEGSASYSGGAAGVYVHKVNPLGSSDPESATSGHFSADVNLTVYFDGDDVAVSKQNTVTGSISNFVLSGEEENSWTVNLKGTRAENANVISGDEGATGGGIPGDWNGTFYGSSATVDHDMNPNTPDINPMPGAVVGEFNANFSNGSAAGGFGARKE